MKRIASWTETRESVEKCLMQIATDFGSGNIGEDYKIYVPRTNEYGSRFIQELKICRPDIVYDSLLKDGLKSVVKSFTDMTCRI